MKEIQFKLHRKKIEYIVKIFQNSDIRHVMHITGRI